MELEAKDKDQLVEDVKSAILEKIPDLDFSDGEPIRTIIEAIMEELDLQYWHMTQIYENSFIDTAIGDDLDNLVKILGVERIPAKSSNGQVKFYRETPAPMDYIIPAGTLVETLPNGDGDVIRFETIEDVMLLTGQTEVLASVKSIEPGLSSNIIANKVIVINNPPIGTEFVINPEAIIGGEDEEEDDVLRERAKNTLETSGLGTINAITGKISTVSGVKSVKVIDMARGIGTIDVLVLGDALPMPASKITELTNALEEVKAGGIDIRVIEPTITPIYVEVSLQAINPENTELVESVNKVIDDYIATLGIGESFIINQLLRRVLETSDEIIDAIITLPVTNVHVSANSIITLDDKYVEV